MSGVIPENERSEGRAANLLQCWSAPRPGSVAE